MYSLSLTLFYSLILSFFFFTACDDNETQTITVEAPSNSVEHAGFITADETWSSDKLHILKERVIVKSGVTLTIQPGTIVKGEAGTGANASSLVIARGAKVSLVTNKNKDEVYSENIWQTIEVENTEDDLFPFLVTIPLQKLAYYSALKKGYDIDKPRNLAKSVTVE